MKKIVISAFCLALGAVANETATETRVTLEDTKPLTGAAFYRVVVSVP